MGINEGDTYLILRPMSTWKRFQTKEELIATLDKALSHSARHRLRFHAAHGHPYRRNRLWPSKRIWPSKSSATTSTRLDRLGQQIWFNCSIRKPSRTYSENSASRHLLHDRYDPQVP
jgi:hypothetical protein